MNEAWMILSVVLPVFCVAGAGFWMRRVEWLTEEADRSLLRITINLLAPCLIFASILSNQALRKMENLVMAPLVGFGTVALGMGIAWIAGWSIGMRERALIGTFALCTGLFNYGYVPIPLTQALFDRETVGVLFVHNVGVEMAMWTLGLLLLNPAGREKGWRHLINAPLISIVVALSLNFIGPELVPRFAVKTVEMLGACAIPMGLILIGATVADHFHDFHSAEGWKVMTLGTVIRLGLLPALFLLLARFLPCSLELKRVIIIQAAMPAAVFPIVMARHYRGDPPTALRVVIGSSIAGFVTMPFWIHFGMAWVLPD